MASAASATCSLAVTITIAIVGSSVLISFKTSRPLIPGMVMSRNTMSGRACRTAASASAPVRARLDQLVVHAGHEAAAVVRKDRTPRDFDIPGSVLGLPVPRKRAVEPRQHRRVPPHQLVVHRDQAHESADAAFARGVDAVQADELRGQIEPCRIGG